MNISDAAAWYAAIIGTFVLLWDVYKWQIERKERINIMNDCSQLDLRYVDGHGSGSPDDVYREIKVKNIGGDAEVLRIKPEGDFKIKMLPFGYFEKNKTYKLIFSNLESLTIQELPFIIIYKNYLGQETNVKMIYNTKSNYLKRVDLER